VGLKSNSLKNLINKFKGNEILSKGSSAFIFKIIGSFLGYLFLLLVTKTSGAEAWGIFALCMALLNITSILSRFGVDTSLLRFVAQLKGKTEEVKGVYFQGISLVLFLSILFSVLLFFFSDIVAELVFRKPHLTPYFKIISFALVPFSIIHINVQTLRGLKKIKEFAFFQHVSKFLFAIIFFFLLTKFYNFHQFSVPVYAFTFAVVLVMIVSLLYIFKKFKGIQSKRIFTNKEIIKTSFPMMLSSSVLLLMAWSDTIMIGIFKTEADVGVYNVALKLAMITGIVLGAVNSIVAPKLSETFNNNKMVEFRKLIKQSTRIIFFSTLPILIILLLFPEFLLSFFGTEFIVAKTTLLILLIGQIVNAMSGSVGFILQMTGKEKVYQNILLLALVFNIALNIILIPKFGIEGAAIASAFSLLLWNLSSVFYIYKQYHVLTFFNFKI
jgi:O-antigen/teichoic acid export membrane protein